MRGLQNIMNKKGFTLAELLITLGAIGVIAALTIPTLHNNSSELEFRSAFKKGLAALNQAITMNVAVDKVDFNSLTNTSYNDTTADSLYSVIVTRLSTSKFLLPTDDSLDARMLNIGGVAGVGQGNTADKSPVGPNGNVAMFFTDGSCLIWNPEESIATRNSNGIFGIRAIWDVNGGKKPNRLTWCDTHATNGQRNRTAKATEDTSGPCTDDNIVIRDQYSILLRGDRAYPNGKAAYYIFYMK